ncbi:efflux RND transporter periplasmic adaptor subunit [Novosphingopyxis sp. YJ-S2-01]|uniref:efflux RND transporter periplasmic adaptor subunit n=1 Tax=Novosphingopyxis sp. YJ-S2-01 TaxID=2794021 RepID=UPI0018DBBDE3|nr:HlyD family secretion protein [Novosphingopyxis sp. YJ-S2-01]MBH9536591.1 HlyD family secretion protein [Novosphingopyxis sp. YJ-S2-01]
MTRLVPHIGRILLTLLMVALAIAAVVWIWRYYETDPWTRDGKVRVDVVEVSADVSGIVTDVLVRDNQPVKAGDPLFVIDRARFKTKLAQVDAGIENARASLANARRDSARYQSLGDLVSAEVRDQRATAVQLARADLRQKIADREMAALDLDRATVRARVNGLVTNLGLRPGDYVQTGKPVFALVDTDSYYVVGYFEETKLDEFRIGDKARVTLLGNDDRAILGHVDSISGGIDDRESQPSNNELPNIQPTFSWIRLAQRVPVRIVIDKIPRDMRLIAGRTASVTIVPTAAPRRTVGRPVTPARPKTTLRQGQPPLAD